MTARIVVFEGADSSGKTTLASALSTKIGAGRTLHAGPFVGWVEEAHRAMIEAAGRRDGVVAFDRHWVSEFVYGPTFRGGPAYGDTVAKQFDRTIRERGLYVLCVPSNAAEHEARFQREHAAKAEIFDWMDGVAEVYRRIATGYMHQSGDGILGRYIRHGDFGADGRCMVYDLDRDGPAVAAFADKIEKRLKELG